MERRSLILEECREGRHLRVVVRLGDRNRRMKGNEEVDVGRRWDAFDVGSAVCELLETKGQKNEGMVRTPRKMSMKTSEATVWSLRVQIGNGVRE